MSFAKQNKMKLDEYLLTDFKHIHISQTLNMTNEFRKLTGIDPLWILSAWWRQTVPPQCWGRKTRLCPTWQQNPEGDTKHWLAGLQAESSLSSIFIFLSHYHCVCESFTLGSHTDTIKMTLNPSSDMNPLATLEKKKNRRGA